MEKVASKETVRRRVTEQVIAALLTGLTIKQTARDLRIGERTIKRWLASEWFQNEYQEAKRLLLDSTINRLRSSGLEGVDTLREVARNKKNPPAARATAGRALLEVLLRAVETQDLAERLAKLEILMKNMEDQ